MSPRRVVPRATCNPPGVSAFRNPSQRGAALKLVADDPSGDPALSDTLTLTQFFERWFVPVVLVANERSPATVDRYRELLSWWAFLTLDPPIKEINERLIAGFAEALKHATFGRDRSGCSDWQPSSMKRDRRQHRGQVPLARATICAHLERLGALVGRLGHHGPKGGAVARILPSPPVVPRLPRPRRLKPSFTLEEARAIAAATGRMGRPELTDMPTKKWWQAWIAMLFYTGLRTGTIRRLRWRHVVEEGGKLFLDVPAALVKTRKPIRIAIHPQLASSLRLRFHKSRDHLILPIACHARTFLDWHAELQQRAGLAGAQLLSPHAWRRTHGQLLAELGLANAEELARCALDHSSAKVTTDSYVSIVDQFRLRLPELWPGGLSDETQPTLW